MPGYLLSDHVGVVVGFHSKGTVVGPEIDRNADASDAALVDLQVSVLYLVRLFS